MVQTMAFKGSENIQVAFDLKRHRDPQTS